MGKQTKRQRKFQASGGIKGRLEKGTVTKKGKLRKRKRTDDSNKSGSSTTDLSREATQEPARDRSNDFATPKNLAELDLDAFFEQTANAFEERGNNKNENGASSVDDLMDVDDNEEEKKSSKEPVVKNKSKAKKDEDATDDKPDKPNKPNKKQKLQKPQKQAAEDESESESDDDSSEPDNNPKPAKKKPETKKDTTTEKATTKVSKQKQGQVQQKQQETKKRKEVDGSSSSDGSDSDSNDNEDDNDSDSGSDVKESNNNSKAKKQQQAKHASSSSDDDDSNSDSDEDEDVEGAEQRMKAQMAKLTKSDPEFHEFLQENEKSLLEFGDDDEDEDLDDDDDDELDEDAEHSRNSGTPGTIHLTLNDLQQLEKGVFELHGLKHLKRYITAYRSACHLADTAEGDERTRPGESGINYVIESPAVFDRLMVTCLSKCHDIFRHHLFVSEKDKTKKAKKDKKKKKATNDKEDKGNNDDGNEEEEEEVDENVPLNPAKMEKSERWVDMKRIMLSFFSSTLHIMSEAKDPELLAFILKALSKYMVFLSAFSNVAEVMLKSFVDKWSAPLDDSSEEYQVVRINAFFRIRQMAVTQPFPFIEACLRKTYLAYARRSKHGKSAPTSELLSTLTFMGNSVVELYNLDLFASYQHAFVYIRQLALHLRTAMQKPTPENLKQIFHWQYMHCLKLWVAVLSNLVSQQGDGGSGGGGGAHMRSLIYPLSEVIYGVARLAPSNRFLPFRLHCVRLLQQLAAASETYIPTTSLLLDCLDWKEWYIKPKKTAKTDTTAGVDMQNLLKLPKEDSLRTHEQLESGITELFVLLEREVDLYIYTAAFPEFSSWIRRRLRTFCRDSRQARWRGFATGIVETCDKYAKKAVSSRAKLAEAPKDVKQLECLRPAASVPSMYERHKTAVDKEAKRIAASKPRTSSKEDNKSKEPPPQEEKEENEEEHTEQEAPNKEARSESKKRAKLSPKPARPVEESALEQEDDVKEGIDWSDDDDE